MDKLLSLKIPGSGGNQVEIQAPAGIPAGGEYTIGALATGFLQVAMVVGILLSLFYLIYGGFFWIQTRGNKEKLDKARRIILYSIVGLIIMSLALVIVNVIATAFGVNTADTLFKR